MTKGDVGVGYGEMIRRAWKITWRYKALWVLGIFAGVSGCQPGGGGSSGGGNTGSSGTSGEFGSRAAEFFSGSEAAIARQLPLVLGALAVLLLLGLVIAIVSVAARGGLIHGVDVIEKRGAVSLREAWGVGWAKWGSLFLIGILLAVPVLIILAVIGLGVGLPIIAAVSSTGDFNAAAIAPLCGFLVIGIPLLIVVSVVIGLLRLLAERYAVIGNRGAFDAIGAAWGAIRARMKDSLLMYLLSGVLNAGAGLVLAIPMVIITVAAIVPAGLMFYNDTPSVGTIVSLGALLIGVIFILGAAFNAIWGTFTSALWTLFFRRLTGLSAPSISDLPVHPPINPSEPVMAGVPVQPPIVPPAPLSSDV